MSQPLQEWFNANRPDENLYWRSGLATQVIFVRDQIHHLLCSRLTYEERKANPVRVVSTHRSKSVLLPVFEITTPEWDADKGWPIRDLSVRMRLRYNFFNWVVSVESKNYSGVKDYFRDLFDREAKVLPVYAEGFMEEWVFGSYAEDRKQFTANLYNEYDLWTFCWLMSRES